MSNLFISNFSEREKYFDPPPPFWYKNSTFRCCKFAAEKNQSLIFVLINCQTKQMLSTIFVNMKNTYGEINFRIPNFLVFGALRCVWSLDIWSSNRRSLTQWLFKPKCRANQFGCVRMRSVHSIGMTSNGFWMCEMPLDRTQLI